MLARDRHAPFPPVVVDDDLVDVVVDVAPALEAKRAALAAHATQIRVEGDWFALSDDVAQQIRDREAYQLAPGWCTGAAQQRARVGTDLFTGVRADD
jgi:N-acetyl-1-D-myo-inositol-2-amino-2-deoxy-alpha-D-glucopyranoside deacetylase